MSNARLAGTLWLIVIIAGVVSVLTQTTSPRVAFAANLFAGVCYLGVTVLLYELFKSVEHRLALFAACCGLAGVASGAATELIKTDPPTLGFYVSMLFFGFQILSIGYLITRSHPIPRVLGVLLMLGGASYFINSFANFLGLGVGASLGRFVIPIAILGEGALTFWLVVKGATLAEARARQPAPSRSS
ncbi:MAG TPA: DUF4386 domain-containing protein [Gemmatimonadales bacterium]|nr:DUF4386 domain-containing protein [Gemmatimonadales bacterium]